MLDDLGLPGCLDIDSSAELFGRRADLRHGTSAIRYAAFVSERNYTGSSPPLVTVPLFRRYVFDVLAPELDRVPGSAVIPLGRAVDAALGLLIDAGALDRLVQHPAGVGVWAAAPFRCSNATPLARPTMRRRADLRAGFRGRVRS